MAGGTFKVLLELEKNAPFSTVAALHNLPGVSDIHLDFDQFSKKPRLKQLPAPGEIPEVNGHGPKGKKIRDDFSPSKAIIKLLAENGGVMKRADIKKAGGELGERMVSNINALVKAGKLRQSGPAEYALSAETRRELARASREQPKETGPSTRAPSAGKLTGAQVVLGMLAQASPLTRPEIAEGFKLRGKSPHSVGDQLDKLIKSGQIKRHPRGPDYPRGAYVLAEA